MVPLFRVRPVRISKRMIPAIQVTESQADVSNNDIATAQTVRAMGALIREAGRDFLVRRLAVEAVTNGPLIPKDEAAIAAAIWQWCKNNITFVSDESQLKRLMNREGELELLISPSVMVRPELLEAERGYRRMEGDCDCFTMCACSMLLALGVAPLIKTFKCDRREPWRWSHVCAAATTRDGWTIPVDASHGPYAGWEVPPEDVFESQCWDMNGRKWGPSMRMSGMNGYVSRAGWRGSQGTSDGSVAGPYYQQDFSQLYRRGRQKGLGSIARRKYGMGDLDEGEEPGGHWVGSSDPLDDIHSGSSSSGSSFNWGNLFGSVLSSGAKLASQAIGPGATILPNGNILRSDGTIISGQPAASSSLGISSSTLMIGGLLIGGLILVSVLKK